MSESVESQRSRAKISLALEEISDKVASSHSARSPLRLPPRASADTSSTPAGTEVRGRGGEEGERMGEMLLFAIRKNTVRRRRRRPMLFESIHTHQHAQHEEDERDRGRGRKARVRLRCRRGRGGPRGEHRFGKRREQCSKKVAVSGRANKAKKNRRVKAKKREENLPLVQRLFSQASRRAQPTKGTSATSVLALPLARESASLAASDLSKGRRSRESSGYGGERRASERRSTAAAAAVAAAFASSFPSAFVSSSASRLPLYHPRTHH